VEDAEKTPVTDIWEGIKTAYAANFAQELRDTEVATVRNVGNASLRMFLKIIWSSQPTLPVATRTDAFCGLGGGDV
jgi:hypothetical protein